MHFADDESGVDALEESISLARSIGPSSVADCPQAVWFVSMTDDEDRRFGHVFTLHMLPDGTVMQYQSYIAEYTLTSHVQSGRARLDAAALDKLLWHLRTLESGSGGAWTPSMQHAYKEAFGVKLVEKTSAGEIELRFITPCVVPPWNGSAADVSAPGHASAVAMLVPALLQRASINTTFPPAATYRDEAVHALKYYQYEYEENQ